jgi:hypothetical protein
MIIHPVFATSYPQSGVGLTYTLTVQGFSWAGYFPRVSKICLSSNYSYATCFLTGLSLSALLLVGSKPFVTPLVQA